MRRASEADLDLVRKWVQAFVAEVLPNDAVTPEQLAAVAARRVGEGELYLWERDDVPVGIAGCAGSTRNGIRITNVYTPKALRGQGIASALVASLSALMLAQGRVFCFLYIDAANPVSAHVYESVGYRPVCNMRHTDYV
jgi:predicted GNAT family acetyltransferase